MAFLERNLEQLTNVQRGVRLHHAFPIITAFPLRLLVTIFTNVTISIPSLASSAYLTGFALLLDADIWDSWLNKIPP